MMRDERDTIRIPKKLIEVALPLKEINAAAKREKPIRHGHPSTLHLWWAQQPLAAARAILFAKLVSDPGYERELTEVERKRLFEHIKKLVPWENTCRYLYLPRLQSRDVLRWTIEAGTDTKDYFRFESAEFEGE
jgi:hypothetical protein